MLRHNVGALPSPQLSLQVHDINGRVQQMKQLLESNGYSVVVFKEARFTHCCLFMVYASR